MDDPLSAVDSLFWREGPLEFTNYQWLMKSSFRHMKEGIYVSLKNEMGNDGEEDVNESKCNVLTRQSKEESEETQVEQPGPLQFSSIIGPSVVFSRGSNGVAGPKPCLLQPDLGRFSDTTMEERGYSLQMVIEE